MEATKTTSMKSFFTFLVAAAFILGNAANATIADELVPPLTKLGIELSNPATR
jgi:hypothetical protein